MDPAFAAKVADVLLAETEMEAGVVSKELLSERVTVVPPAGAALVKVTVQVLEALDPSVVAEQINEDSAVGAARVIVEVFDTPPSVAVTTAD